jgi:hypothetical protein
MNKSNIHPELHQLVNEQSRNRVAVWVYLFMAFPILITLDWWKLALPLEARILSYAGMPGLLFAIGYGFYLLDKRRFRRLSWLLYNARPVAAKVRIRLAENDENLRYEATLEPLVYVSPVLPAQKILVDIPDWDSTGMINSAVIAECYLHPDSQECEIIRTEKGLLIRL